MINKIRISENLHRIVMDMVLDRGWFNSSNTTPEGKLDKFLTDLAIILNPEHVS